ncbi:hypothetical protein [Nonomuraea sp. SYSU D8015]|uniref:hypothetical protein n=1 Tax=Nonomuraea sp. SYSU D8015 TaxID=2593644 RepID=UPI00166027BB|nr:hypothetical protein [Nonomuraea sp. SYSU D8015]
MGLFGCAPALFTTREDSAKVRVLSPLTGRDLVPPIDLGSASDVSYTAWITRSVATVDGRTFAFVSLQLDDSGHARLWDLSARTPLSEPVEEVYSQAFTAGDGYILTPGPEERILLWRLSR